MEHRRCLITWLVFSLSGEKISQSGIKPSTIPLDFGYFFTIILATNYHRGSLYVSL